uniref:Uncharacterized protein n=1 Tax=Mycena chlorophos TaxID=658473 RepID=A0ABQ0LZ74_MYCCL|nr:predicted protein [Mycena chlorophos]
MADKQRLDAENGLLMADNEAMTGKTVDLETENIRLQAEIAQLTFTASSADISMDSAEEAASRGAATERYDWCNAPAAVENIWREGTYRPVVHPDDVQSGVPTTSHQWAQVYGTLSLGEKKPLYAHAFMSKLLELRRPCDREAKFTPEEQAIRAFFKKINGVPAPIIDTAIHFSRSAQETIAWYKHATFPVFGADPRAVATWFQHHNFQVNMVKFVDNFQTVDTSDCLLLQVVDAISPCPLTTYGGMTPAHNTFNEPVVNVCIRVILGEMSYPQLLATHKLQLRLLALELRSIMHKPDAQACAAPARRYVEKFLRGTAGTTTLFDVPTAHMLLTYPEPPVPAGFERLGLLTRSALVPRQSEFGVYAQYDFLYDHLDEFGVYINSDNHIRRIHDHKAQYSSAPSSSCMRNNNYPDDNAGTTARNRYQNHSLGSSSRSSANCGPPSGPRLDGHRRRSTPSNHSRDNSLRGSIHAHERS